MTIVLLLAAAVVMFFLLSGKGKKDKPKPAPTTPKRGWHFLHSYGMPDQLTGQSFDFPSAPNGVHVLATYGPFTGDTMTTRYSVTGGGFVAKGSDSPALVSSYFQTRGDLSDVNSRWVSRKAVTLAAGDGVLSTPMIADAWINTEGKSDPVAFKAAWEDMGAHGISFGHETGRAHGVRGSGRFTLNPVG